MRCFVAVERWNAPASKCVRVVDVQENIPAAVVPEASGGLKAAASYNNRGNVVQILQCGLFGSGERHVVLPRCVDRGVERVARVPQASIHVYSVSVGFRINDEGVVFDRIPLQVVLELHLDSQPVSCALRHLEQSFQTQPEIVVRVTEAALVVRPGTIEGGDGADLLLEDDPVVDGQHGHLAKRGRRRQILHLVGDFVICNQSEHNDEC